MKKIILSIVFAVGFLAACSKDENTEIPCTPIPCLNNGVSNTNCGCDCPQGFGGANCGNIITPSKIIITKVIVKSFNNLNNSGVGHDLANGPDIYIQINSGSTIIYDHPSFFSNATAGLNTNYEFVLNPNLQITNVNSPLIVSLWDYDLGDTPSNADDNMGIGGFFPFNGTSFPNSIIVTDTNTPTQFEIFFTYQW